ncbi:MAG TPA: MATE family efflux transporter, partial [Flavobacteriales bacterium]|nr:MATE family efflux transporter [Flavobacteriales bacterium]
MLAIVFGCSSCAPYNVGIPVNVIRSRSQIMFLRRLFNVFMESLSGEEKDYTSMGIRRAIVLLSIPMILEMGMEALFALVDLFWVGRLGDDAKATIGLTESLLMTTYCIAWGLAMGATAVVARRKGEKNEVGM